MKSSTTQQEARYRSRRRHRPPAALVICTVLALAAAGARAQVGATLHTVTAENRYCGNLCTRVNGSWGRHPLAAALVTHNWNPPGHTGTYYDSPLVSRHLGPAGAPSDIIHGTGSTGIEMPIGAAFNVLNANWFTSCFYWHQALESNTVNNHTFLPILGGVPDAFLLVTVVDGFARNVGVWYSSSSERWAIFLENQEEMPLGSRFLVHYACSNPVDRRLFSAEEVVRCTAPSGNRCDLGALAAGDRNARLLVTQLWTEADQVYNPHNVGVYYSGGTGTWRIFNEDLAPMPVNASFNVAVINVILNDTFESANLWGWSGGWTVGATP